MVQENARDNVRQKKEALYRSVTQKLFALPDATVESPTRTTRTLPPGFAS